MPVKIVNLFKDGTSPNSQPESASKKNDVFVFRFRLFDPQLGVTDASQIDSTGKATPTFIRLAEKIDLTVTTQDNSPNQIYVPVLTISYRDIASTSTDATIDYSVRTALSMLRLLPNGESRARQVIYTMDTTQFWSGITAASIVFAVCAGLGFLKTRANWRARNLRVLMQVGSQTGRRNIWLMVRLNFIDDNIAVSQYLVSQTEAVIQAIHAFVLTFFPFVWCICGYIFVFYKLQVRRQAILISSFLHNFSIVSRPHRILLSRLWKIFISRIANTTRSKRCSTFC